MPQSRRGSTARTGSRAPTLTTPATWLRLICNSVNWESRRNYAQMHVSCMVIVMKSKGNVWPSQIEIVDEG